MSLFRSSKRRQTKRKPGLSAGAVKTARSQTQRRPTTRSTSHSASRGEAQSHAEVAKAWGRWAYNRMARVGTAIASIAPPLRRQPVSTEPVDRERAIRRRMAFCAALILLFMAGASYRAFSLHHDQAERLSTEARRNYLRSTTLVARRGAICDRWGETLSTSVRVDTIVANPREVDDPQAAAAAIAGVIAGVDPVDLAKKLGTDKYWHYIKRRVPPEEAAAVAALELPGIFLTNEWKRFYPKRELGGQLLGRVGLDAVGLEGLERALDPLLIPRQAQSKEAAANDVNGELEVVEIPYVKDFRGRASFFEGLPADIAPEGYTIHLTIDEKIQDMAERHLANGVEEYNAFNGMAVVMDVATGELLAVAHAPTFNPNDVRSSPQTDWRNRAFKDVFEPGSTFKIFALAAVLDRDAADLDEKIDVHGGRKKIGRYWIHDLHRADEMTVREVIGWSSNIGISELTGRIGKRALWDTLEDFGFGTPTGVEFDAEAKGLVQPLPKWADITFANISFGQGIAVTALQLTRAAAAIGNYGQLMRPMLVKRIATRDGEVVRELSPQVERQVIRPETAKQVIEAMKACASPDGTGKAAMIPGYTVAGKTGTAQKAVSARRRAAPPAAANAGESESGYAEDAWTSVFVGLVPAERPRLAVLVVIDEVEGGGGGGAVAAPVFKQIAEGALRHLGVAPSVPRPVRTCDVEAARNHVALAPPPDVAPKVARPKAGGGCVVPNVLGAGVGAAVRALHQAGVDTRVIGSGRAVHQDLAPGSIVTCGKPVAVRFESALERLALSPDGGKKARDRKRRGGGR